MRQITFELLNRQGPDLVRRAINTLLISTIVISSVALVLTTEPTLNSKYGEFLQGIEGIACIIFLAEYILRIWSCPESGNKGSQWFYRVRYIFSFMGIVDLLSFAPFLLILSGVSESPLIMLLQLSRLIKLTRYSTAFGLLGDVLKDEKESLLVSIVLMLIILIFASVGIYTFEHHVQPKAFGSIPSAMWWAIVTLTTVGYGDVTPITVEGKIFATIITIVGVGLVSLPTGIIASGFTEQLRLRREKFQSEVEQLLHDDGKLTADDMGQLERDRQELGINRERAELIISQVQHREQQEQMRNRKR